MKSLMKGDRLSFFVEKAFDFVLSSLDVICRPLMCLDLDSDLAFGEIGKMRYRQNVLKAIGKIHG
jgi:hypothetical protein